jgi:hypothetical protein
MELPHYNDPILRLQRRIEALEQQVRVLQANARPTIPVYTPSFLADIPEQNDGEFWINTGDGKLYFQINGVDSKVSST